MKPINFPFPVPIRVKEPRCNQRKNIEHYPHCKKVLQNPRVEETV